MKTKYLCPECRNSINVGEDIVLAAKNEYDQKGIVMLHTTLGNYTSKVSSEFTIAEGDKISFICPLCHHHLGNKKNDRLARLVMVEGDGKEFYIIFSQIYGEKCTFKLEEKEVKATYGEHLSRYTDPEWFMWF
ncbi:MAG TPA: hypothetical protein DCQ26_12265 [Marinilabiliales bacterium]|jgi:uncharacterized protein YlaI|nr:MAG: hypothetical protein A2W95_04340 [Bacteroidetes bacterium GWA2_40_14]OFX60346.1 MAG: hypothetical protein A2W84_08090 [Bacteroidetes bacterium GWC2_40_13]OFX76071.1 MAG: hypothetical protein A2W96_01325 [Bacteroidetes bacterium GWD2_40_43]OFX94315.1 MAG: hypothetical protein A2W97_19295 [Bacteroidetes bacterium GWE2_40_63]OFY18794.1 MAG: hypothetical protein A2W88_06060 [Bacteroidetes bacterium GWF2_40_13]OFZ24768.1 MAG: hypothetical protein A2437_15625 [Bacteroidetes bacterium RIFOXYC